MTVTSLTPGPIVTSAEHVAAPAEHVANVEVDVEEVIVAAPPDGEFSDTVTLEPTGKDRSITHCSVVFVPVMPAGTL